MLAAIFDAKSAANGKTCSATDGVRIKASSAASTKALAEASFAIRVSSIRSSTKTSVATIPKTERIAKLKRLKKYRKRTDKGKIMMFAP